MVAYIAMAVVDFAVPFALGFASAPAWTPLAWAFAKGAYVGFVKWPPPELLSLTRPRPGILGYCFGTGLATVLSSNTLWFYVIFVAGLSLRRWLLPG
jgi:hypothetical protein